MPNNRIKITFDQAVLASNYGAGVEIRKNGVVQSIIGATRQSNHAIVYYDLLDNALHTDVVTWQYTPGDIAAEVGFIPLGIVSPKTLTNLVGQAHFGSPTNLVATPAILSVALSWTGIAGSTYYKAYRATVAGGPYTLLASPVYLTNMVDNTVSNHTVYYYVVTSLKNNVESDVSNEASASAL